MLSGVHTLTTSLIELLVKSPLFVALVRFLTGQGHDLFQPFLASPVISETGDRITVFAFALVVSLYDATEHGRFAGRADGFDESAQLLPVLTQHALESSARRLSRRLGEVHVQLGEAELSLKARLNAVVEQRRVVQPGSEHVGDGGPVPFAMP